MVVETAATDSGLSPGVVAGHRYVRPLAVVGLAALATFNGALGAGPAATAAASAGTLAVLLIALAAWRLTGGHRFGMQALLPAGRELWALGATLAVLYMALGVGLRPRALPIRPLPHVVVLALYAVLGGLFLVALRTDGNADDDGCLSQSVTFTWPRALGVATAFVLASAVAAVALTPLATLVFVAYFLVSVTVGIGTLAAAAVGLRR